MVNIVRQLDFFDIPSPCVGICVSNRKGFCKGCLRSREERLYWLQMNDDQKHQVMRLIFARRKKLQQMAWERQSGVEIELPEQESFEF